jgi:hypothetical protein
VGTCPDNRRGPSTPEAFAVEQQAASKAAANAKSKSKRVKKDGTAQTTWTGPNGKQAATTTTRTGGDTSTTYTGPDGQTATRTTTFTPAGSK